MTSPALSLNAAFETPASPFPGLRPFRETESHLFFGRDEQAEKLAVKLAEKRFLAVVGTSGSGKSSLVRAGLISSLRSGMMAGAGHKWRVAEFRPTNDPIGNLARALNSAAVFGTEENAAVQNAVTEATLRLGSRGLIEAVRQNPLAEDEHLLVLVDQFEELFRFACQASVPRAVASASDDESLQLNDAAAFVKLLLEAVKPAPDGRREANIYVVLTMRSDFLGDCSQFWDLPEAVTESQYLIPRLTRDQLREVIEGPVAIGSGKIAPRLVNQLLNDIADNQDQLPILQHALMRTWDRWIADSRSSVTGETDGGTETNPQSTIHNPQWIDLEHYEATGEMANALSKHADEAYAELPDDRHCRIAERMFKALTEKGEDNREIRRPVEFGQLRAVAEATEEELKTVIEIFREPGRSFLMPPAGIELEETTLVDISHESLIRVWTKLQQWAEDEAESAAIYLRLADAARRKAELWRGKDLQEAEDWESKNKPTETWAEHYNANFVAAMKFLQESRDGQEIERNRQEAERLRQEAERLQWQTELLKREMDERNDMAVKATGAYVFQVLSRLANLIQNMKSLPIIINETTDEEERAQCFVELRETINSAGRMAKSGISFGDRFSHLHRENCRLKELIQLALGETFAHRRVTVMMDSASFEDVTIRVDPDLIKEVFINLINNAVKSMSDSLRQELMIRGSVSNTKTVTIKIQDTDRGMTKEEIQAAERGFVSTHGHKGVGVLITRLLLNAQGGTLSYRSTIGVGTEAIVTLPLVANRRNPAVAWGDR